MLAYHKFLGRPYVRGHADCFSLARDYYQEAYGIWMPNVARPSEFWEDEHLDFGLSTYRKCGFNLVLDQPLEEGDALLMSIQTKRISHVAVVVPGNRILHHLYGSISREDPVWPKWGGRAQAIIRHPKVTEHRKSSRKRVHLHDIIDPQVFRDPEFQRSFERVLGSDEGKVRDDYVRGDPEGEHQPGS